MIEINKKNLLIYLNYIKYIINKKNKNNLIYFILEKTNTNLKILFNNEKLQINIKIKYKLIKDENFKIFILYDKFYNIIKNLNCINIKLKYKNLKLKIINNSTEVIIDVIENILYENIIFFKTKNYIDFSYNELKNLIKYNYFIINKLENIDNQGVYFNIKKNKLLTISTDNYRLSYLKINLDNNKNCKKKFILPINTIILFKNIIKNKYKKFLIKFNNNKIKINFKNICIISNLIIDEFPEIDKIYFKKNKNKFILNRIDLKNLVERSLAINKTNYISYTKWDYNVKNNLLKIITNNKNEKLIDKFKLKYNNNFKIFLNNNYLKEFLNNVKSNLYEISYLNKYKLLIINVNEFKNIKYKYILTILKI